MNRMSTRRVDLGDRGEAWIVADAEALAREAAALVINTLHVAVTTRGVASVALSGGSTPKRMGELFAGEPYASQMPWPSIEFFWGDERTVPIESPDNNAGVAMRGYLDHVDVAPGRVHPWQTDLDPAIAAENYEALLGERLPIVNRVPQFDLVLLGMGDDGHTASLFPHTAALAEIRRHAVANEVPQLNTTRLTLTAPVINNAGLVVFLIAGAGKANRLAEVIEGPTDSSRLPSQLIRPENGRLIWLLDEAAAGGLHAANG
jgi:6-phosphogluconolactonase